MQCKDCKCAIKGYYKSIPEAYVCIGTKEPFIISNFLEAECTEYKDEKNKDGIYMELFAIKDGVRYNAKIVNMKEVSTILTNGLMDGIQKLW